MMRRIFVRKMITCRKVFSCRKLLVDRQHGTVVSVDFGGGGCSEGAVAHAAPLARPALCRAQRARRKGQHRASAGSRYRALFREPGQAERSLARGGNASCSTAPSPDNAGECLGSRAGLCISPGKIRGLRSRPCALSTGVTLTHLVPLPPFGSCLPLLPGGNEGQPKPLWTSVTFRSWPLAHLAREGT